MSAKIGWFAGVCEAVAAAHEAQILHRDLKPSNILIDAHGNAVVTDFGLAKFLDEENHPSKLTATGQVLGTPGYMAPEQVNASNKLGMTTDVYGLGAVLYYLLVGRAPFIASNVFDVAEQVRTHDPIEPIKVDQGIDQDLSTIAMHCLRKIPGQRYQSVAGLIDDVRRWQASKPIEARSVSALERVRYWRKRNPLAAFLAATLVASVVVALFAATYLWRRSDSYWKRSEHFLSHSKQVVAIQWEIIDGLIQCEKELRGDLAAGPYRRLLFAEITDGLQKIETLGPLDSERLDMSATAWFNYATLRSRVEGGYSNVDCLEKALNQFRELARRHPGNSKFPFDQFHCLKQLYRFDEAHDTISKLVLAYPEDITYLDCLSDAKLQLVKGLLETKEYDKGIALCNEGEKISTRLAKIASPQKRWFYEKKLILLRYEKFRLLCASGRLKEAKRSLEAASEVGRRLAAEKDDFSIKVRFARCLILASALEMVEKDYGATNDILAEAEVLSTEVLLRFVDRPERWIIHYEILAHQWMNAVESGDHLLASKKRIDCLQHLQAWETSGINRPSCLASLSKFLLEQGLEADLQTANALEEFDQRHGSLLIAWRLMLNGEFSEARKLLGTLPIQEQTCEQVFYVKLLKKIEKDEEIALPEILPTSRELEATISKYKYFLIFRMGHFEEDLQRILEHANK